MAFHHFQKLAEGAMASVLSDPELSGLHPLARQAEAHFEVQQNYPAFHAIITLLRRDNIKEAAHEIGHEGPARSVHAAYLSARSFLLSCVNVEPFTGGAWRGVLEDKGLVWTGLRYAVLPQGLSHADCDVKNIPESYISLADRAIVLATEDPDELPYKLWYLAATNGKLKELRLNTLSIINGLRHAELMERSRVKLVRLARVVNIELPAELSKPREGEKIVVRPPRQPIKSMKRRTSPKPQAKPKTVPAVGDFLDQYGLSSSH